MKSSYITKGTCSSRIDIEVSDGIIKDICFTNGCAGNLQGLSRLAKGMRVDDAIHRLRGIRCGTKDTSCPDQLAKALELLLPDNNK